MGIQGLLPFLKKCSRVTNLSEFRGKTVAVDAYCWLHKGAFSCADKLVKGEPTVGYILYVMKQVNILLSYNIKPILVFDGCHLPSKAVTETKRRENREKNRKRARELLREGKEREARECFQRCVDVTSEMARQVIEACRERNIDIIVAPYEADAQLAYLNLIKIADLIITEDSDLILFGCERVLFKLDGNGGGVLIERDNLHMCMNLPRDKFTFDKFRHMCVLSGCDYLPSLHGIGLAKACKFFTVITNPDIHSVLCRLPSYLKMPSLEVTQEYRDGFMKAVNTFKYQLVFNPISRLMVPLNPYEDNATAEDFPYAGKFVGHERALQIALGNINVQTGDVVDDYDPINYQPKKEKSSGWHQKGDIVASHPSIWRANYDSNWHKGKEKKESMIPSLISKSKSTTLGKEKIISTNILKRKREPVPEEPTNDADFELESLYGITQMKKVKNEMDKQNIKTEELPQINQHTEEQNLKFNIKEEDELDESFEKENEKPKTINRNPFVKKSPVGTESKLISALKKFSKPPIEVNTTTIVQSRFFRSETTKFDVKKAFGSRSDDSDSDEEKIITQPEKLPSKKSDLEETPDLNTRNNESPLKSLDNKFSFRKVTDQNKNISNETKKSLFSFKKTTALPLSLKQFQSPLIQKKSNKTEEISNDEQTQNYSSGIESCNSSFDQDSMISASLPSSNSSKDSNSPDSVLMDSSIQCSPVEASKTNMKSSYFKSNNISSSKATPSIKKSNKNGQSKPPNRQLNLKDMFGYSKKK